MNPLANPLPEIAEECGAVIGYCDRCGGPIFEGDEPESFARVTAAGVDDFVYEHWRCRGESDDPARGVSTQDLAQHLFALGADLARAVLEQVRGGAA